MNLVIWQGKNLSNFTMYHRACTRCYTTSLNTGPVITISQGTVHFERGMS